MYLIKSKSCNYDGFHCLLKHTFFSPSEPTFPKSFLNVTVGDDPPKISEANDMPTEDTFEISPATCDYFQKTVLDDCSSPTLDNSSLRRRICPVLRDGETGGVEVANLSVSGDIAAGPQKNSLDSFLGTANISMLREDSVYENVDEVLDPANYGNSVSTVTTIM